MDNVGFNSHNAQTTAGVDIYTAPESLVIPFIVVTINNHPSTPILLILWVSPVECLIKDIVSRSHYGRVKQNTRYLIYS